MTIRRRLAFSFLGILVLFAVNLMIYFWSNQRRQATVESLRRAISRQILLSSVNQTLNDMQKQVSLLSQVVVEAGTGGAAPAEVAQFGSQIDRARKQIAELRELSDPQARQTIQEFQKSFEDLSGSWRVFYQNFGVDQTKAITEMAVRADPLSQKVLQQLLPHLQSEENARVDAASANFYQVARLTDRITVLIFLVSTLLAIFVAYVLSRYLTHGLGQLKAGAAAIGIGNLDQRITLAARDELGDLARAFNHMAERLATARAELTRANEQERKKSDELAGALDQLRKAQDQLIVQQKLASLGSLTAGIAHEIKNPLNFVVNFADVSVDLAGEIRESLHSQKDRIDEKEYSNLEDILADLERNVAKIRDHGKRADSIVRGMLMHSRGHPGDLQFTNINNLLAEDVRLAYHGLRAQDANFNITIEEAYDSSIEPMSVVPQDLSRVFLNIINNACYAANEKKKTSGAGFFPVIFVNTQNLGDKVEVRIRDNGDGIPEAIRKKVFEPFFTTKPTGAGTGLGLSMSYDIVVQEHKGQLTVQTEEGRYAEFIITLPK